MIRPVEVRELIREDRPAARDVEGGLPMTPSSSSAARIATRLLAIGVRLPFSKSTIVCRAKRPPDAPVRLDPYR
jgi:hypothetical protein